SRSTVRLSTAYPKSINDCVSCPADDPVPRLGRSFSISHWRAITSCLLLSATFDASAVQVLDWILAALVEETSDGLANQVLERRCIGTNSHLHSAFPIALHPFGRLEDSANNSPGNSQDAIGPVSPNLRDLPVIPNGIPDFRLWNPRCVLEALREDVPLAVDLDDHGGKVDLGVLGTESGGKVDGIAEPFRHA